jgi:hypothetical protein
MLHQDSRNVPILDRQLLVLCHTFWVDDLQDDDFFTMSASYLLKTVQYVSNSLTGVVEAGCHREDSYATRNVEAG